LFPVDPSVPEMILAGAGQLPPSHSLSGFGGLPASDDSDEDVAEGTTSTSQVPEDQADALNVGFVEDSEEEEN
jgi:hypothetical protein